MESIVAEEGVSRREGDKRAVEGVNIGGAGRGAVNRTKEEGEFETNEWRERGRIRERSEYSDTRLYDNFGRFFFCFDFWRTS
jgi:hypothetical protein